MKSVNSVFVEAAETFKMRDEVYGSAYLKQGEIMQCLFPLGMLIKGEQSFQKMFCLEMIVNKLVRFVQSDMTHEDSMHDLMVYACMLCSLLSDREIE
jgi:hypothetical protein